MTGARYVGSEGVSDEEKEAGGSIQDFRWVVWVKLGPLIPARINPRPRGGGRKPKPDRQVREGTFFVLRTGCQWKALDETGTCPGSVAHARFQKWVQAGVFLRFWQEGLREYDECKGTDWSWQSMDGAMTKAPLGEKTGKLSRPASLHLRLDYL